MSRFKYFFLVGLLTFGSSILIIGLWRGLTALQNQNEPNNVLTQTKQVPQENIDLNADETFDDVKRKSNLTCPENQTKFTFQNISFNCYSKIGTKIEVTEYLKSPLLDPNFRPDGVHPSYLSFKFKNDEGKQERETKEGSEISVYPIEEYIQMYSITDSQKSDFEGSVASLKRTIYNKQAHRNDYNTTLAWMDAGFNFKSHIKYVSFKKGKGVGFVTQIQTEITIINNEELVWVFEGITNDGKYYIKAVFPIQADILPENWEGSFEGYSASGSNYPKLFNRYKQYISLVKKRLDVFPSNKFEPDLANLTKIIDSLEVK